MDQSTKLANSALLATMRRVAPDLARYTGQVLFGDVWQRPALTLRERSLITLAVLIARHQSEQLPDYLALALDNGVQPREISGLVAHLAVYAGWGNATAALKVIAAVFAQRGVDAADLAKVAEPLPAGGAAEAQRHAAVSRKFGAVAPGLVQLTQDLLFQDLWLQPELSLRDRCLVTICSVIATAQTAQLAFYLHRALDHGVTQAQLAELMTQVAFYSGWSSVYTALAVAKEVFESRPG